MNKGIYLDYNATTPIDPIVASEMMPYLYEKFGNPSSNHQYGIEAKLAIENARKKVAKMLNCNPNEIIFTSGGTESNNYAIRGIAHSLREKGNHLITSKIEHPSVLEVCRYMEQRGYIVTYLEVDENGLINLDELQRAIIPETILITIMHANNEVGTIEPIEQISEIAKQSDIILHTDSAQSIGKIPVDIKNLKVDLLTVAGHKLYAPKGVGALYIRSGVNLEKMAFGADHEMNLRPGTENVLEIVGLGKACELVSDNLVHYRNKMSGLRDYLESGLKKKCENIRINGHPSRRLPNTLSVSFKDVEANKIIEKLPGLAISPGAACHSDKVEVSHVIEAMKVPKNYAIGTIRFSVGRNTIREDIDYAINEISEVITEFQSKNRWDIDRVSEDEIQLTQYTQGLGCACKIQPHLLHGIIDKLLPTNDNRVLVGLDKSDDAAVYKIDEKYSIIQTLDFFTPIVDDPFTFGAIAASNSLSDIYAMGGNPLFALNIVAFPSNKLPNEVLERIIEGAQAKVAEANISIIGGHSIVDEEPKYGLVVTGIIDNNSIITNSKSQTDDDLVLTKPIGSGILSFAKQKGILNRHDEKKLQDTMMELNKCASESMLEIGVNACTDITGFGLLGHLLEMMKASNKKAVIEFNKIKLFPNTIDFAEAGIIPKATEENDNFSNPFIYYDEKISYAQRIVLNDVQTSGGLLISCPSEKTEILIKLLQQKGVNEISIIGKVESELERQIKVIP